MKTHARVRRDTSKTPRSVIKAREFFPTPRSAHFVIYVVDKRIYAQAIHTHTHTHTYRHTVTTKPTPNTVHSATPGQLHVEGIQLACTCALCCCYALCMKREELLIFYSFWLRCFVVMMQYVGFLGRSQLFGSQIKVGAPTWQLARANSRVGAPTGAPTPVLARAKCPILPLLLHPLCIPFPF